MSKPKPAAIVPHAASARARLGCGRVARLSVLALVEVSARLEPPWAC